jgi:peptidoglycan/LPS O-acetylase OafA/YrhL
MGGGVQFRPELDGLRGLAALMVLLFHARVPGMSAGFMGVEVFFVLSGYLITAGFARNIGSDARQQLLPFLKRRLLRLVPAMLAMLAGYVLLAQFLWLGERHDLDRELLLNLSYMGDYARPLGGYLHVLTHTWSLAVEMKFYLLWPPLLCLCRDRRDALALAAGLFVLATLWRVWRVEDFADFWWIYAPFDTRAAALLLGAVAALAGLRLPAWLGWACLLLLGASFSVLAPRDYITALVGFSWVQLLAVGLVCAPPAWLAWAPLAWFGRISYGFYLWHFLLIMLVREFTDDWLWALGAGAVGGLLCGAASYYLLEIRCYDPRGLRRQSGREADALPASGAGRGQQ